MFQGFHLYGKNYTLNTSKFPRFLPSAPFLTTMEFYLYENLEKVIVIKIKFIGQLVNLNPISIKNLYRSDMLG